ncbi:MAG: hypothetical protein NZ942_02335 [Candidatus Aenigmarchaeota archaeon]|nr:hypothetical protein [Candidatus Aenigmarchaeota archaeon]
MKKVVFLIGLAIVAIGIFGYYYYLNWKEAETAKEACIKACMEAKAKERNLKDGPCLSNKIIENWVCDVAHNPRQHVDDLEENQCQEYGKSAQHFVEVDPNCNFIRAV